MAVFWWIAIRHETFVLLTTSLFVAPLLLLRSEESTQLGVKWAGDGLPSEIWREDQLSGFRSKRFTTKGFALLIAFLIVPPLLYKLLDDSPAPNWSPGCIHTALRTPASCGFASTGYGPPRESIWREWAFLLVKMAEGVWIIVVCLFALLSAIEPLRAARGRQKARSEENSEPAVGASTGSGSEAEGRAIFASYVVPGAFLAVVITPSLFFGLWLGTIIIRIAATARFAHAGYQLVPVNVRRLALCMAPLQQPELLPGLPKDHELRLSVRLNWARNAVGRSEFGHKVFAVATLIFAPIVFVPAWAYRFILKSTLWFWWILLIVAGAPRISGGIEGLRADAYRKATAWVGITTTIFAVVGFGFGWLFKPWVEHLADHAKLPAAVALLVLVDWKSVPIVQWVTLASALTTIAVVIWTRDLYVDSQNPMRAARVAAQLPWLGHLVKWKSGFGAAGLALLMLYIALYAIQHHVSVSDWAAGWLFWLYGTSAERLHIVGV
jgi:hypothetical protein